MDDPEDDDTMTEAEYAELEAELTEAGYMKDGKLDMDAIRADSRPFTEFDEWYDEKLRREEASAENHPK